MRKILGFGTYPIVRPVHGGQRRVAAFQAFYASAGVKYAYGCVYNAAHYGSDLTSHDDRPSRKADSVFADLPFMEDMNAGEFAASDEQTFRHFHMLIERLSPDAVQLEQPFLWPLVRRLRDLGVLRSVPLIYSSHNVEGPLKGAILRSAGVSVLDSAKAEAAVAKLEAELADAADLVIAVSTSDAAYYAAICGADRVVIVRNGVARFSDTGPPSPVFGKEPYLFFVGSAYPPNVEGFCAFALEQGLYYLPPRKRLAICGGVSHGIFNNPRYQADLVANSERVQFFPNPDDAELDGLRRGARGALLPITFGGGSNLKTAEALATGQWVVASPTALRGFEGFSAEPGVLVVKSPREFRLAAAEVLRGDRLELDAASMRRRDELYWDKCFAASGSLCDRIWAVPKVESERI